MMIISGLVIVVPANPAGIPFQGTDAVVETRLVISEFTKPVKSPGVVSIAEASPMSWATIVALVVANEFWSMTKSINALVIVVPWGTVMPVKRNPRMKHPWIKFWSNVATVPVGLKQPISSTESSIPMVTGKVCSTPTRDCVQTKSKASSVTSVS